MPKFTRLILICSLSLCLSAAQAAHSNYSPMSPRSIVAAEHHQEYSYGLTVLPGHALDNLEPLNRYVGWILAYDLLDRYLIRPLAHGYALLPSPVRTRVGNFFGNLDDLTSTVNHALMLNGRSSGLSLSRFAINSTLGLLGLFDVASFMGLERDNLDMKTVFGRYGVSQGAYLMTPVGPNTLRDIHGNAADGWPYYVVSIPWVTVLCYAINNIHKRASFIDQEALIDNAIDPYGQMRQIYLMYAEGLVDPKAAAEDNQEQLDSELLNEIDG